MNREVSIRLFIAAWTFGLGQLILGQEAFWVEVLATGNSLEIHWPGALAGAASYEFEIQQSVDLRNWQAAGVRSGSGTPGEILRFSAPVSSAHGYYRLLARPATRDEGFTAAGGAEVFGYASRFAAEVKKVGLISREQFAVLHPQPEYLPGPSSDPTQALYWAELNTAPADKDRIIIENFGELERHDFRLNDQEKAVFKQHGFVVSERLATPNFAESFYRVWEEDLPVFVSTDAILQAWHRSYDAMLEELEETCLFSLLERILEGMSGQLDHTRRQFGNGAV
jgi:hypothetical protein